MDSIYLSLWAQVAVGTFFMKSPVLKTLAPIYMCDKKIDNVKQLKKTNQKVFSEMKSTKLNIIF